MIRRLGASDEGATAVEFALVLLPFLLFIFGTFEAGRAYFTHHSLQTSADEVSRYLYISYGSRNVSATQLVRDAETWVRDNYRYGDASQVRVSGTVGQTADIKYREIVLSQPIRLLIPVVDVSFEIEAVRHLPY